MESDPYFNQLDAETRGIVSQAYSDALRQLKDTGHPALSPGSRSETGVRLCWLIVELSSQGIRDPARLKAYALASMDAQIMHDQLEAARSDFEAKAFIHEHFTKRYSARADSGEPSSQKLLQITSAEASAAKARYVQLLILRAESNDDVSI